ncbi:hypothetical protein HPB50_019817 [Hyalomma asiaticum]|uniref:Uncharacterized protein n=1 Tax=Hyalomma asiaticum TaxID=266040 RepID=A0ACB7RXQ6_HYAAI|nr:hypothetical protein HPB50_019817 [Hyalomma asiaticum]
MALHWPPSCSPAESTGPKWQNADASANDKLKTLAQDALRHASVAFSHHHVVVEVLSAQTMVRLQYFLHSGKTHPCASQIMAKALGTALALMALHWPPSCSPAESAGPKWQNADASANDKLKTLAQDALRHASVAFSHHHVVVEVLSAQTMGQASLSSVIAQKQLDLVARARRAAAAHGVLDLKTPSIPEARRSTL